MKVTKIEVGYLRENCYVLENGKDECLVVDPGDDYPKIKDVIKDKKVLKILITHHHFDHIGALKDVLSEYNCGIIDCGSNDSKFLISDFCFEKIDTMGHSNDSVSYYFEKEKIMFTGDFLFNRCVGRCDLKGGSYEDMAKSIKLIRNYDKDIKVYPGHGDATSINEELLNNPYLKGESE